METQEPTREQIDAALDEAKAKVDQARDEIVALKETNARLNRRCQAAESAALQNVKACVSAGLSFSRTLANWYAIRLTEELRLTLPLIEKLAGVEEVHGVRSALGPLLEEHRQRILRSLPDPADLERWRAKHVQPKDSAHEA